MNLRSLRQGGHTPSLIASVVHFDVSFMMWVLVGALGAYISKDLGLSDAQKGLMVAVPPIGGSAFRLLLGPLADRLGIKRLGLTTLAITVVPLAWGAMAATTYGQILAIGALLGVAGASFAVAMPLTSRWYPPHLQGLALGIAGAGNSGTVVSALVAPRLAERIGWHATFGVAIVPVVLAWVAFAVLAKEPPRAAAAAGAKTTNPFGLLRIGDARWLCSFYAVSFGGFVGLAGYLGIYFVDAFDVSKVRAGTCAAICTVAGSLLRPVGGALADRFGSARVIAAVLGGAALLAVTLTTGLALVPTVATLFVLLGALGMSNGAVFQAVGARMPAKVGAMTGLVGAAGGLGGFALPFCFGALRGATGSFAIGFVGLTVILAFAAVGALTRVTQWRAFAAPTSESATTTPMAVVS